MEFNHTFNLGEQKFICFEDDKAIIAVQLGKIEINNKGQELYGFKIINATKFGYIDGVYSYKPFNSTYEGSYYVCMAKVSDIFDSLEEIKDCMLENISRFYKNEIKKIELSNLKVRDKQYYINKDTDFNLGDKIYYYDIWTNELKEGIIEGITLLKEIGKESILYDVKIKIRGGFEVKTKIPKINLYESPEEFYNKKVIEVFDSFKVL